MHGIDAMKIYRTRVRRNEDAMKICGR